MLTSIGTDATAGEAVKGKDDGTLVCSSRGTRNEVAEPSRRDPRPAGR
jgi:hypothetical protein